MDIYTTIAILGPTIALWDGLRRWTGGKSSEEKAAIQGQLHVFDRRLVGYEDESDKRSSEQMEMEKRLQVLKTDIMEWGQATAGDHDTIKKQAEANLASIEVLVSEVNKLKSDLGGMAAFGQSPLQQRRQQGAQR